MATYPEIVTIPFNNALMRQFFLPLAAQTPPPSGPGYWAILQGTDLVLDRSGTPAGLPEGPLPPWLLPAEEPLCIGRWKGRPLRAFSLDPRCCVQPPFVSEGLNAPVQRLDDATLSVGGLALQLLHWERQSRYCPQCGGPTERASSGWSKLCPNCRTRHLPHLHPCAIVLVRRETDVLLVHKGKWKDGRYGLVSGFVDFGEALEECAAREVREETGIEITDICYVGSQSWPFPSQLMAGFTAQYAGGEIAVDLQELEDARWFPIDALPTLPPKRSIARRMIDRFCR